jgi:hypothetical protein
VSARSLFGVESWSTFFRVAPFCAQEGRFVQDARHVEGSMGVKEEEV